MASVETPERVWPGRVLKPRGVFFEILGSGEALVAAPAEQPGFAVSERSVCGYVKRRRQQLGLIARESFVPQSYNWGVEGQVDFHEPCQSSDFMLNFAFASSILKLTTRLPFAFYSAIGPDA
jgi:hypothetical protein